MDKTENTESGNPKSINQSINEVITISSDEEADEPDGTLCEIFVKKEEEEEEKNKKEKEETENAVNQHVVDNDFEENLADDDHDYEDDVIILNNESSPKKKSEAHLDPVQSIERDTLSVDCGLKSQAEEQRNMVQIGSGLIKIVNKPTQRRPKKDMGRLFTSVCMDIELTSALTRDPDGGGIFARLLVDLVKQYSPKDRKVEKAGIVLESREFTDSVGHHLEDIKKISPKIIEENMEKMVQSGKDILNLENPVVTAWFSYISPPTGSGKRIHTGHLLDLYNLGKKVRQTGEGEGGTQTANGREGEEEEEEEEVEENDRHLASKQTSNWEDECVEGPEDGEESEGESSDDDKSTIGGSTDSEDRELTDLEQGAEEDGAPIKSDEVRIKGRITNVMKNNVARDCLPHALYQAEMYREYQETKTPAAQKRFRDALRKSSRMKYGCGDVFAAVKAMKKTAKMRKSHNFGRPDIDRFQKKVYSGKYQIICFVDRSSIPFYVGPYLGEGKELVIFLKEDHFYGVKKIPALLGSKYYCSVCDTRYKDAATHYACKLVHRPCGQKKCTETPEDVETKCPECTVTFRSQKCFDNHKKKGPKMGKSRCEFTMLCEDCGGVIYTNKRRKIDHVCGGNYCHRCEMQRPVIHHCVMPGFKKKEKKLSRRRIFFDIESRADTDGRQIPVLFVALSCCPACSEHIPADIALVGPCKKCAPTGRMKVIECITPENRKVNVTRRMIEWLFKSSHSGAVLVAHNASGYDAQFILSGLLTPSRMHPTIVESGSKIIFLQHQEIRLVDSFKYLSMSLQMMGKTFDIAAAKGDFPILFIDEAHFDYIGPMPDDRYYNLDRKSTKEKDRITQFLKEEREKGTVFNFFEELLKYCSNDVYILACSMTIFEKEFEAMTNVCLLEESTTAASAAVAVFRRNHLDHYNPIVLDGRPDVSINVSVISQKYLSWFGIQEGVQVNISTTYGEKKVGPHRVDGFVPICPKFPEGLIIEFFGCYYHAHECVYNDKDVIRGESVEEIRGRDAKRISLLETFHKVEVVWECEVRKMLKKDEEMREFFDTYEPMDILRKEKALVGGRTEVFRIYIDNILRLLRYLDVNSLYPSVMKHEEFPVGPPENVEQERMPVPMTQAREIWFKGFMSCLVLPPRQLRLPVLPMKGNGRLVFALCFSCVKEMRQESCNHEDSKRAFNGTFTTIELVKALELGYTILKIYHAIRYPCWAKNDENGTGGLFTGYINQMLVEKIYSSGWPANVITDAQKDAFCRGYEEKEKIVLDDRTRFKKLVGKRQAAKIMLNSLWGKFAQRVDRMNTTIVSKPSVFLDLYYNKTVVVDHVRCVNNVLIVKHRKTVEELQSLKTGAVHIAAYTTSYARLRLYKYMELVGPDNIIYTDTDSIIYAVPSGQRDPLKEFIGPYLGQLTNELEGKMEEFVTIGPKSYCYKETLRDGTQRLIRKAKGITINSQVDHLFTFDLMKRMVDEVMQSSAQRTIQTFQQFNMRRDAEHQVYSQDILKNFKYTFNKRRVLPDGTTLPYGYCSN